MKTHRLDEGTFLLCAMGPGTAVVSKSAPDFGSGTKVCDEMEMTKNESKTHHLYDTEESAWI